MDPNDPVVDPTTDPSDPATDPNDPTTPDPPDPGDPPDPDEVKIDPESILHGVKKLLGLPDEYDPFDEDLIAHINAAFFVANQLSVERESYFAITGYDEVWSDFSENPAVVAVMKQWLYLKVRMVFDPPTGGTLNESYRNQIAELEFRLNVLCDTNIC